ncbi:restriction endonuclease [Paraburkholderia phenazinium]|jgi:restriction system protein|uniref:Restriction system protein n=1 Tax=Paraburkholderia phenazinium TaxID=60549 RepID=A0A1N6EJ89_9BURK|nr:restriction endonuclease [Paraburkholderia phenazinium]SIN83078.1 restriction system protein [Paraburkholderia phenazinium]
MTVPTFQQLMLPLLTFLNDECEHGYAEAAGALKVALAVSDADLAELLPSGKQTKFMNRLYWAKVHLSKALLVETTTPKAFRLTKRGISLLNEKPETVGMQLLLKFPEYRAFRNGKQSASAALVPSEEVVEETPEEQLEAAYRTIRQNLEQALLTHVLKAPPAFFEQLVIDLLIAMGYGGSRRDAGRAVGKNSDGGIDGIISEDRLGLDIIYLQAKRWHSNVGSPEVRDFVGSLVGHSASKGVFLTTSSFSKDARDYVRKVPQKVILIDGSRLAELLVDYGIGVSDVIAYHVKKVDTDYFGTE